MITATHYKENAAGNCGVLISNSEDIGSSSPALFSEMSKQALVLKHRDYEDVTSEARR
jgi:hypothetical protein